MMPFKHIFFQAVMCWNLNGCKKKYVGVFKMKFLFKESEIRPLFWNVDWPRGRDFQFMLLQQGIWSPSAGCTASIATNSVDFGSVFIVDQSWI